MLPFVTMMLGAHEEQRDFGSGRRSVLETVPAPNVNSGHLLPRLILDPRQRLFAAKAHQHVENAR